MTDLSVAPVTVKFPHRSRRGILLGLSLPQLVLVSSMLALLLMTVISTGLLGAVALAPLWAASGALVAIRRHGRSLIDWAPIVARYAHRRRSGQTLWLARPVTRPRQDGILHLPGTAASLKVVTPGDSANQAAAVHDPHQQTLTAIARVSSRAFALLDPTTQNHNVGSWGRALAGIARTGHIATVQVLERTVPDSGDTLTRHWTQNGQPHTPVAGQIYSELVASAGPAAAPHETYLAISLDLKAARRLINQAGGGLPGAFTVMQQTTASIAQAARNAGLQVTGWLTSREIAAVIRTAYDPKALAALQQWSETGRAEADPAAAGPVVQFEEYDRLATDSARHATYWVENWPRTEMGAGFLHGIMFTAGVRRSLSLIYVPQGLESALRDVQRKKAAIIADANERARRGQVDSEEDSVEYADVKMRERQLIAGHADVALTGLVTVTAETDALLDAACAQIETHAVTSGVDLRRLNYQQPDAFALTALPLARTAL
ncbi:SCO6880 family protein [Streptomyces scabiei]|uniref:SCO6880 family protein n=1 Tax=Streptomyces TaxID=1883 RepID=UPI0004E74108|nr:MULTISPECIES: SCO6880 family protein [Streptomyces]KFG10095.1 membrane protein [Streptomyces scabiei]MDX2551609.1 type VII secretion protein EccE [Streptomyces stelliscabiei]MDX2635991.1 type VII secretion protein EccE [Streptomyces stelliscabiei]MDX2805662.1 type VII secretion protein EccE [Streptomyces scabiei]MDX3027970.1 type VII secretion protein EccE [Streptomyces scabiei]